ncbi:hypothetical protein U996_02443, partial [Staphylococcus aureus 1111205429]
NNYRGNCAFFLFKNIKIGLMNFVISPIYYRTYLFKSKVNAKDIDFIAKLIVTGGVNVKVETPNSLKNAVKVELTKIINMY